MERIKFINAQKAKKVYRYKSTKEKLQKTKAATWFNKMCSIKVRVEVLCNHKHPDDGQLRPKHVGAVK